MAHQLALPLAVVVVGAVLMQLDLLHRWQQQQQRQQQSGCGGAFRSLAASTTPSSTPPHSTSSCCGLDSSIGQQQQQQQHCQWAIAGGWQQPQSHLQLFSPYSAPAGAALPQQLGRGNSVSTADRSKRARVGCAAVPQAAAVTVDRRAGVQQAAGGCSEGALQFTCCCPCCRTALLQTQKLS